MNRVARVASAEALHQKKFSPAGVCEHAHDTVSAALQLLALYEGECSDGSRAASVSSFYCLFRSFVSCAIGCMLRTDSFL